jgi:hypothetical protein
MSFLYSSRCVRGFVTAALVFFLSTLFFQSLAQTEHNVYAAVYSGFQLGAFQEATYSSSPHPGWKAGLQLTYDLHGSWRLSGEAGVSFLNCHVNNPQIPMHFRWQYLWAEVAPPLSYVPIQRSKFNVAVGSGISIRRILTASNGEALIYPWTYFLPIRLSSSMTFANRHSVTFSAEYSAQVRRMYRAGDDNYPTTTVNKMYSYGIVVAYTLPCRSKESI